MDVVLVEVALVWCVRRCFAGAWLVVVELVGTAVVAVVPDAAAVGECELEPQLARANEAASATSARAGLTSASRLHARPRIGQP